MSHVKKSLLTRAVAVSAGPKRRLANRGSFMLPRKERGGYQDMRANLDHQSIVGISVLTIPMDKYEHWPGMDVAKSCRPSCG